jgi:hypothetical protein
MKFLRVTVGESRELETYARGDCKMEKIRNQIEESRLKLKITAFWDIAPSSLIELD